MPPPEDLFCVSPRLNERPKSWHQFIESESAGITIALGDLRALAPLQRGGRGDGALSTSFLDPNFDAGIVILDSAESWNDAFGDNSSALSFSFFRHVLAGIGDLIGLGNASNLSAPAKT